MPSGGWNILLILLHLGLVQSHTCEDGWVHIQDRCLLFVNDLLEYNDAVQKCIDESGTLFEPKNALVNGRITGAARGSSGFSDDDPEFWIGVSDATNEGNFAYQSSGSSILYSNWNDGEPNNDFGTENCVAIVGKKGKWFDQNCTITKKSICEDPDDEATYYNACPEGWDLINKKCYRFVDQTLKFDTAIEMCKAIGGQVFEPTYEVQEQLVKEYYFTRYQQQAFWIGVSDRSKEGSFTYASTNAPVQYTNWASNSFTDAPDNTDNSEDCTIIKGGKWDEICCETGNVAMVVCEELPMNNCNDPNYAVIEGRCIYISTTKSTYAEAELDCIDKGGRLFEPKNSEVNMKIYEETNYAAGLYYWIGINGRDSPGDYIYTSNNEAIAFENWNTGGGQPNQENNQANCVLVQNHKAQWGDIHCDAKRKYVCEFPDQYSAFYDSVQLDTAVTDAIDMVFEKFFEIRVNTQVDNTLRSPSRRRFLSIGGLSGAMEKDTVYIVDLDTKSLCYHSTLPVQMKEVHAYELNGKLMVCSTFTSSSSKKLQCFTWSGANGWEALPVDPVNNGIFGFIYSVRVPGVGIWFQDNKVNTLTLLQNETWTSGVHLTNMRFKHCTVMISPTVAAIIGGRVGSITSETIDTYDFQTGTESLNVTQLPAPMAHMGCINGIKGKDGNPTVAILGTNINPVLYQLVLWDTVTNEVITEDHPPGFDEKDFFRPTMLPYDDSSFLLLTADVADANGDVEQLQNVWQYVYGFGWINLMANPAPLNKLEQTGAFWLDNNPPLDDFVSLDRCAF